MGGLHLVRPLLIVVLAALLAYAVSPAVRMLSRVIPSACAIALMYLTLIGLAGGVGYLFVVNATTELAALTDQITRLLSAPSAGAPTLLVQQLEQFGLSQQQIQDLSRARCASNSRVRRRMPCRCWAASSLACSPPCWMRCSYSF